MRAFAVVLMLGACTAHTVAVRPGELAYHAQELLDHGKAKVGPEYAPIDVSANDSIDVRIAEGDTQRPTTLTVRELVAGCVADPTGPTCLAFHTAEGPGYVHHKPHLDHGKVETALTFGLMGGAVGACIAMCQDDTELKRGFAYAGGAFAIFAGALILLALVGGD